MLDKLTLEAGPPNSNTASNGLERIVSWTAGVRRVFHHKFTPHTCWYCM